MKPPLIEPRTFHLSDNLNNDYYIKWTGNKKTVRCEVIPYPFADSLANSKFKLAPEEGPIERRFLEGKLECVDI